MVKSVSPGLLVGLFAGFVLMTISLPGLANRISDLQPFLWENRLILISAPESQVKSLRAQLLDAEAAIDDRHIVWFIFSDDGISSNYAGAITDTLSQSVGSRWPNQPGSDMQVVLVGKDGGNKLYLDELDLPNIFVTIDGMPMRQREMQQSAGS